MVLIGSDALLWHAFQRGLSEPLPENSMDVDPITDSFFLLTTLSLGRPG